MLACVVVKWVCFRALIFKDVFYLVKAFIFIEAAGGEWERLKIIFSSIRLGTSEAADNESILLLLSCLSRFKSLLCMNKTFKLDLLQFVYVRFSI